MAQEIREVTVSRHVDTAISNADVDAILTPANAALQTDSDGPWKGDVACDLMLKRSGDVAIFKTDAPKNAKTKEDLKLILAEKATFKLVESIDWCSHKKKPNAGNFEGCTKLGIISIAVTDYQPN